MPDFLYENQYAGVIVGVDEAGRGAWSGPVVAAAVNLNYIMISGIADSKKISAKKRNILYQKIIDSCDYGVGIVGVSIIDEVNILQATKMAMAKAVSAMKIAPNMVLIDGNQLPEDLPCSAIAIVRGDGKSLSIAAASIVAKVTRDRIMQDLHQEFPYFAWDKNAGYGTKLHQEGLAGHGVTQHHRSSFAPIKKILALEI